jgi:hypothetical protein
MFLRYKTGKWQEIKMVQEEKPGEDLEKRL